MTLIAVIDGFQIVRLQLIQDLLGVVAIGLTAS